MFVHTASGKIIPSRMPTNVDEAGALLDALVALPPPPAPWWAASHAASVPFEPVTELEHYASQFLANNRSPRTAQTYAYELRQFIQWLGPDRAISTITFEDLLAYRQHIEPGRSPQTVTKKLAALKAFFRFAKQRGWVSVNPAEDLQSPSPVKGKVPTHLEPEEVDRLLKMPDHRTAMGKRDAAVLALLAATGLRRQELIDLRMDSFVQRRGRYQRQDQLYVRVVGKGNKERLVPVHEEVVPYLDDWVKVRPNVDHPAFFTTADGKPLTMEAVRHLVKKHGKAAGIDEAKLHPHSFRHFFCLSLARQGVPLHVIQELAGHASLNTLRIYLKVADREKEEAVKKLPFPSRKRERLAFK